MIETLILRWVGMMLLVNYYMESFLSIFWKEEDVNTASFNRESTSGRRVETNEVCRGFRCGSFSTVSDEQATMLSQQAVLHG